MNDKAARIERIREIVQDDYARILQADSPWAVLNVSRHDDLPQVEARYERYERFYRAENFQRIGDMEMTRHALEIRRSIGRAIAELRQHFAARPTRELSALRANGVAPALRESTQAVLDEDALAMGALYFRDGLTYLQIGDLNEAVTMLRRALHFNPGHGLSAAYLAYVLYKRRDYDAEAIDEALGLFDRAVALSPNEIDIYILRARFFARTRDAARLAQSIEQIERLNAAHPMLDKLLKKLRALELEQASG
jgi:tetratricopeptide (TPR) repeat protein